MHFGINLALLVNAFVLQFVNQVAKQLDDLVAQLVRLLQLELAALGGLHPGRVDQQQLRLQLHQVVLQPVDLRLHVKLLLKQALRGQILRRWLIIVKGRRLRRAARTALGFALEIALANDRFVSVLREHAGRRL